MVGICGCVLERAYDGGNGREYMCLHTQKDTSSFGGLLWWLMNIAADVVHLPSGEAYLGEH